MPCHNSYSKDKFSLRAVREALVGYSPTQKGYKLHDLHNILFFISRDVVFIKTVFAFKGSVVDNKVIWKYNLVDTTRSSRLAMQNKLQPTNSIQHELQTKTPSTISVVAKEKTCSHIETICHSSS